MQKGSLLFDEELFAIEDRVADYLELSVDASVSAVGVDAGAAKLRKIIAVSKGMPSDGALARQLKRRFV